MSNGDANKLPAGLPACLAGSAEGSNALCALLGIQTRQEKQQILNHAVVKRKLKSARGPHLPDTKTAARIRHDLSSFFGLPDGRRDIWRELYETTDGFERSVPDGRVPSLEYMAFRNYGAELPAKDTNDPDLSDCGKFVDVEAGHAQWQVPALSALPAVRADLGNWGSLEADRQRDVVLAAFAVASILDDARLLRWVAGREEALATEFRFACKPKDRELENGDAKNEVESLTVEDDIGKAVKAACRDLINAATELRKVPLEAGLFDRVSSAAKSVESLREAVLKAVESADAEALIERLVQFFAEHAEGTPSLAMRANEIGQLWKSVYLEDPTSLAEAEAQAKQQAGGNFRVWADARTACEKAASQLNASQKKLAATPADIEAEVEAAKCRYEHLSAQKEVLDAEERILAAMSPPGHEGQILKGAQAEPVDTTAQDAGVASGSSPSKASAKTDASADEPEGTAQVQPPPPAEPGSEEGHRELEAEDKPNGSGLGIDAAPPEADGQDAQPKPDALPELETATNPDMVADAEATPEIKRDTKLTRSRSETALWECVRADRMGIAYNIARLLPPDENSSKRYPPPALLAVAGLGAYLREPDSDIAQAFKRYADILHGNFGFHGADHDVRDALNLLSFAASLRPAIFAPHTGGLQLLKGVELSAEFTPVYELATAVARHAERLQGVRFGADRLQSVLDASAWDKRWADYQERLEAWRAASQNEKFLYEPARRVWRHWQSPGGILNKLDNAVSQDSVKLVGRVRDIVDTLSDPKSLHKLVEETRRQSLGGKSGTIFGRALKKIERDAVKAVELGRDWLQLVNSRPGSNDFANQIAESLRQDIGRLGPLAISAITHELHNDSNMVQSAALSCARRAAEGLMRLFQDGCDSALSRQDGAVALSHSLLYVTTLGITPDYEIVAEVAPEDALALLTDTHSHSNSLTEAFDVRLSEGDIAGARAAYRLLDGADARDQEAREKRLNDNIDQKKKSLYEQIDELSEKLEQAYVAVKMPESEHDNLNAAIVHARSALNDEHPVEEVEITVAGFNAAIKKWFERGFTEMRAQIDAFPRREDERERNFLDDAVKTGDLITLHELHGRLKAGYPLLPEGSEDRRRLRRFLDAVPAIEAEFIEPNIVTGAVSRREDIFGLKFSALSSEQAKRSVKLLKLWYSLALGDREIVQEFLSCLGFEVKTCRVQGSSTVIAETEPLRDRSLCPLHTFGSGLNGSYRIVLHFRPQPHESIVQALSKAPPMEHPLVFHFGCLGEHRELLRTWGIRNGRKFLTVDTTVLLYVASLPSNWMRAFFDCTLPFSATDPFVTGTAGLVPPELFYGRARDRESIMGRFGSCFVYGGRQLGKTALLRSAKTLFDRPEAGQLARWVDLKARDVGVAHGADHIWNVIYSAFKSFGVIEEESRIPRRSEEAAKIAVKAVGEWIGGGTDRRILLLLDEADPFLAADAENDFRESVRLKGAMEDTERKFKVVFSGLHNVLRTTERANHPLAHFGEPICVGPLLHNGEWEQARALIREPLAAAGCVFEKDSLITHILAWTNYYPSLIQLFGAELVNHLRGVAGRVVPYKVNMKDINAVWANENLRAAILEKFRLTLNLDERYLVIACALALEMQEESFPRSSGLSQQDLFELVCTWWPKGFEISGREFGGLLGEMQGLGVLRSERDGERRCQYSFRNPNMHRLLEEAVDIQAELTKEHALPDAFDQHTFHAKYPSDSDRPNVGRRAPLSFEQEGKLRRKGGVMVVTGTAAANIGQLEEYLRDSLTGEEHVFGKLGLSTNENEFVKHIGLRRPGDRSVHIYLVPEDTPWTFQWVERTAERLRQIKRGRAMRVVFQASPPVLWQFISGLPGDYDEESEEMFEWIELHPWNRAFLRCWCADNNFLADTHQVDNLLGISGGWPTVLKHYGNNPTLGGWRTKNELAQKYVEENRNALFSELGLEQFDVRRQVSALCEHETFTESEAKTLSEMLAEDKGSNVDGRNLVRRLQWVKRLGLIQNTGRVWFVNPLLKRLLGTADE